MVRTLFAALLVVVLATAGLVMAQDVDDVGADDAVYYGPHLLVNKKLVLLEDATYIVQNRPFTVTYTIYNVGSMSAKDAHFSDEWPEEYFDIAEGDPEATFAEIESGTSESVNVTLVPKQQGKFSAGRASVEYSFAEDESEEAVRKTGHSSTFPETTILTEEEFQLVTATYTREWTTFVVLECGPVLCPLLVWFYMQNARTAGKKHA